MRRLVLAAAAWLALLPGLADAATPCLTPVEFAAVTRFALPGVIASLGQRCAAELSPDAFLRAQGPALAARYAEGADEDWPTVRGALVRIADGSDKATGDMLRQMPDAKLRDFVRGIAAGFVTAKLPLDRCHAVNKVARLIAPLPPADTAELIATAVGLTAAARKAKLGPIAVCPG